MKRELAKKIQTLELDILSRDVDVESVFEHPNLASLLLVEITDELSLCNLSVKNIESEIQRKQSNIEIYKLALKDIQKYKQSQIQLAENKKSKYNTKKVELEEKKKKLDNILKHINDKVEKKKNQYKVYNSSIGFFGTSFIVNTIKSYLTAIKKNIQILSIEIETLNKDIEIKQKLTIDELEIDLKNKLFIMKKLFKNDKLSLGGNLEHLNQLNNTNVWLQNNVTNKDFLL